MLQNCSGVMQGWERLSCSESDLWQWCLLWPGCDMTLTVTMWQCDNVHRSLSLIYLWLRDYFLACAHSFVGSSHWSSSYKEIEDAENEDKWTINDGCSANWSHVFVAWQHGNQLVMATLSAHQATEVRVQSGHASCFFWLIAAKNLLLNNALC